MFIVDPFNNICFRLGYEQGRQVLDSTNCTARLSWLDEDDVIVEITDIPSFDPGWWSTLCIELHIRLEI